MQLEPEPAELRELRRRLRKWGRQNFQPFPWRSPPTPFLGLVSEVLLQRTRARNVVPVYEEFVRRYPTAEALKKARIEEVEEVIRPLGLLWRASLLKDMAEKIAARSTIPSTLEGLMELPGVGPYVAAAFLSFHGKGRGVLVDSNVVRWLARLTGMPHGPETRRKRWLLDLADRVTPHAGVKEFNFAILDFTMTVCAPRKPRCGECPLGSRFCLYGRTALEGGIPPQLREGR